MQSLLFCPDEKSARALTPLVEGLDILVKRETEVYSAMRSLMAESFDFLIIDCEDEPTGRLLLRNARGSAINKEVFAVAIVNPETGANALRFGADFLITKPVLAGQAGKVLRLVRSAILRRQRSSPAKSATQTAEVKAEAPSSQSSNLDLAAPGTGLSVEHSAKASSDGQLAISSPQLIEPEIATTAIRALTEDSQCQNEQAPLNEELRSEPPVAVGLEPADPTHGAIESAPQKTFIPELHHADQEVPAKIRKTQPRLFTVSLVTALAVILLIADVIVWQVGFKHSSSTVPSNTMASGSLPEAATTVPNETSPESRTEEEPALTAVQDQSNIESAPGTRGNTVSTSKPQRAPEIRTTKAGSNGKASMEAQLLTATISVNSDPPAAALWMDGRDTGRTTPTQMVVDQPGSHTFVFKKPGYLDETVATNLRLGQTFRLAPSLHVLGRTDEIKMVNKFRRIFGGSAPGEMGTVKVTTQPKGAEIAVNTRILDKTAPAEFYLNPGNYVIDMTLPGFKTAHRVISVDKGGKVAIDAVMDRE